MPQTPIGELFRDFPVRRSELWGSGWLRPDISAFGVLKEEHAALFIEYDGFFRHADLHGRARDERKTAALLRHAPPGSRVLRIGHMNRDLSRVEHAAQAVVDVWRTGHEPSLMKVVLQTVRALLGSFGHELEQEVCKRLSSIAVAQPKQDLLRGSAFATEAVLTRDTETKRFNICNFLEGELQFSSARIEILTRKFPRIWGVNIDSRFRPAVAWLEDVGLSREQVAKVVAGHPAVLGYSIENNLKPTVAWLEDVGLSREQVAKVVAGHPAVLGCSIENNLKPTVAWLEDVGLSRRQVTKVVAGRPAVLSYSIENNLKPTVAWLEDVGLSREQVAKVVGCFPAVLGCSIENNLKPTMAWLEDVGLSRKQVAKVVGCFPAVLGCSIENNLKPTVAWLEDVGLSRNQVSKVVAGSPQVLGFSIENNLKPTVAWLEDVGLSREQVAKVVAGHPAVLGYSLENNLSRKHIILQQFFSSAQICTMIRYLPPLLGLSHRRLSHRLKILQKHDRLSELARIMALTDVNFARRFPH